MLVQLLQGMLFMHPRIQYFGLLVLNELFYFHLQGSFEKAEIVQYWKDG